MDNISPRTARLQKIRDRWFNEPLSVQFPDLGAGALMPDPATCEELVRSDRVGAAFSSLEEAHEALGLSQQEARGEDEAVNLERFGAKDPKALLDGLSRQFDLAPSGQVEPEVLKKSYAILAAVKAGSEELAEEAPRPKDPRDHAEEDQTAALVKASHRADAGAVTQALGMIAELADELGISLPVARGIDRKK